MRNATFIIFMCGLLILTPPLLFANREDVAPKVEILSPESGTCTNKNSINVATWFSAYKAEKGKAAGNVHHVKLLLNGKVVNTYNITIG